MLTLCLPRRRMFAALAFSAMLGVGASFARAGDTAASSAGGGNENQMLSGPKADSGTSTAPGRTFSGDKMRNGPIEAFHRIIDTLSLTDDQKAKVRTAIIEFRESKAAYEQANGAVIKSDYEQLQTLRQAKEKDTAKISELEGKLKTLREGAPKPKDLLDKVRVILTPDQVKAFDEKLREMLAERKEMGPAMRPKAGGSTTQPATPPNPGDAKQLNI